jgi:hypothetical protein
VPTGLAPVVLLVFRKRAGSEGRYLAGAEGNETGLSAHWRVAGAESPVSFR